jgi:hypothetical protein
VIRYLTEDHDRNARRMNDVVVRRIFAAGLDLQAALGLIGDHSGASKIYHAIDELHHAIRDIRDTIFDRGPASISDHVPGMLKLRFQDSRSHSSENSPMKGSRLRADCREKFGTAPLFPGPQVRFDARPGADHVVLVGRALLTG